VLLEPKCCPNIGSRILCMLVRIICSLANYIIYLILIMLLFGSIAFCHIEISTINYLTLCWIDSSIHSIWYLALPILTPKRPNVCTPDKPVLVNVTWAHTIFIIFETFCEDMSHIKLRGEKKSYFLDLRIKSSGCLKFWGEVWAGQACAIADQQELTTSAQKGRQ
jgi:hypothetical protein